jgi:peptide/nickel transport system permease protein
LTRAERASTLWRTLRTYALRRLLLFVPSLLGASLLIFVLMRLVPGDIAEILVYSAGTESSSVQQKQVREIRAELGLDRPVLVQYGLWLGNALRGDFGYSYTQRRPVMEILRERFPRSMELAVLTIVVAVVWAIPLGVVSAVRQNTWADYTVRMVSISGLSLPIFFTGVLILWALVRFFRWLPPLEFVSLFDDPAENLKQLVWPALAQAYYISAPITRLTRSQMLEVIRQDYVRTARAKGCASGPWCTGTRSPTRCCPSSRSSAGGAGGCSAASSSWRSSSRCRGWGPRSSPRSAIATIRPCRRSSSSWRSCSSP